MWYIMTKWLAGSNPGDAKNINTGLDTVKQ